MIGDGNVCIIKSSLYPVSCLRNLYMISNVSNTKVSSDDPYIPVNEALKVLMTEDYHLSYQDPGLIDECDRLIK